MIYKISVVTVVLLTVYTATGSEEFSNNELSSDSSAEGGSFNRVRRGFNMLRLGRGLQMLRLGKRALPMLRLGRSQGDTLNDDEFQYLLSLMRSDRQVPLPRYGKDLALQYMLMKALKNAEDNSDDYFEDMSGSAGFDGFGFGYPAERQIRPAPRPGRYRRSAGVEPPKIADDDKQISGENEISDDDEYNYGYKYVRVAPLMRYGKFAEYDNEDNDVDKRAMRMLRLGRGMRMLRLGKRPVDADGEEVTEADKRALRLLRLGKRPAFHMLRLGRSGEVDQEEEKRALRLLRLGKKSETEES